jgi:hypothetical protein
MHLSQEGNPKGYSAWTAGSMQAGDQALETGPKRLPSTVPFSYMFLNKNRKECYFGS